jgi:TusA-related sulfurtransferase
MAEHSLDANGLVLPLALVRLKQALDRAAVGDTVCFNCDANGLDDVFDRYLAQAGYEICAHETKGACETVVIRKC